MGFRVVPPQPQGREARSGLLSRWWSVDLDDECSEFASWFWDLGIVAPGVACQKVLVLPGFPVGRYALQVNARCNGVAPPGLCTGAVPPTPRPGRGRLGGDASVLQLIGEPVTERGVIERRFHLVRGWVSSRASYGCPRGQSGRFHSSSWAWWQWSQAGRPSATSRPMVRWGVTDRGRRNRWPVPWRPCARADRQPAVPGPDGSDRSRHRDRRHGGRLVRGP